MQRLILSQLNAWLSKAERLPLVLRGARQVGKTWLVRELCRQSGRSLVEINFERDPGLRQCFSVRDPQRVLSEISLALNHQTDPNKDLLFLDEIQAAPEVFASLRWFAEELPVFPVAAAGSLLDLVLRNPSFSVPVGRVGYLHIEPMGFLEYLRAHRNENLIEGLKAWHPGNSLSPIAHDRATQWFDRYAMVGGMPAVVLADVEQNDPRQCRLQQRQLMATFRDDFAKYTGRMDRMIIDSTLSAAAASVGRKFVYAHVGSGVKAHQAKRALELLAEARLCHIVRHTAANGLPLAGEVKDTCRKVLLLDVGLLHALLGTPAAQGFPDWMSLTPPVRSQLTEQLVGQELRLLESHEGMAPSLFYWQREGGRPGEIDYIIQVEGRAIPIEVKSGATGAMKSLHQFMHDKQFDVAVRFDRNPPSVGRIDVKTTQGDAVKYDLLSLPPYMTWRLPELVTGLFAVRK